MARDHSVSCQQRLAEKHTKKGNTPSCFEGHVLSFQATVFSLQEMSSAHATAQSFQLLHRAAPW
jgi:hypothetical protein